MNEAVNGYGAGEAVIAALSANGVEVVFGIPGTHNLEFYRHLEQAGITHVLCRHEQGAAYAADGYFRATGKVAAVLVTSGPGLLNASSGIANAYADRVPMLVLAPTIELGRERRDSGWMHEVKDQRAALAAIVDRSDVARSASDAADFVHRAFFEWAAGSSRPVVVHVPYDVLLGSTTAALSSPLPTPQCPAAAVADVALAHRALAEAERPVVLLGGGCVRAAESLRPLLEGIGAPVIATSRGKGVLPEDHPLSLGASFGTVVARQAMEQADVLLLLGTELSEAELGDEPLRPMGTVIRVDRDPQQLHKGARAQVPVLADIAHFATALMQHASWPPRSAAVDAELSAAVSAELQAISAPYADLLDAMRETLPADARIIGDSSQVSYLGVAPLWPSKFPEQVINTTGFATLGYGIPAAIGAALGQPDLPVVCVLGDGALMFSVQELATAAELGLALPVVVWDNSGFAEIREQMLSRSIAPLAVDITQPDLVQLGAALGCAAIRVTNTAELRHALSLALQTPRPTLIHIPSTEFQRPCTTQYKGDKQ